MITLSQSIQRVQPSLTIAAAAKAQELKSRGMDVVSFTVGEPDFDTPQHIKDAATEAMKKGFTKYTAVGGIPPLKQAIAEKLKRDQKTDYRASEIIVTNGGKQAIAALCAVLLNPGDEVIIPSPYWTSYPDIVRMCGAEAVIVKSRPESGYVLSGEDVTKAATAKTRMVILNTPSNPTGAAYTESQLKDFVSAIRSLPNGSDIIILSDEVYEPITYDGFQHLSPVTVCPECRDQTVIVNAFSKAYSMTGWRVGYAAGPAKIIEAMTTHQSQFTTNVCSIAQYAAAVAYNDNYAFPKMMAVEFQKRYQIVCDAVDKIPGVNLTAKPKGAFYAYLRIDDLIGKKAEGKTIAKASDFADYLLEKYYVGTVPGEAFGDPSAIRLTFALSTEQLQKGLSRIAEAVSTLS